MYFYKIQALGNDFVVFGNPSQTKLPKQQLIQYICDRHYGVGADCAVYISKSQNADFQMHVYNPDGFEAEMCGNALRCSAAYVNHCGFYNKKNFVAESKSGNHLLKISPDGITAHIGTPKIIQTGNLSVAGVALPYFYVSIGNPHCVIPISKISDDEFEFFGKTIEQYPIFSEGTNVEFAHYADENNICIRTWERGIGETLSCSTGSCACVAAGIAQQICSNKVNVHQKGGVITVNTSDNGEMHITGKCEIVFKGELYKTGDIK